MSDEFLRGDYQALPKRKLTEETCRKFGYRIAKDRAGRSVQVADYRDAEGNLVAQKVRGADKSFTILGNGKDMPLFGAHLWGQAGRRVVVVEGELDCLSVAQCFGNSWPVVSLPNGAQSAAKAIKRSIEWLTRFEQVVFMLDMDEPGRAAAAECAALLPPGKAAIAELPMKDASELLQAGLVKELTTAVYQARAFRPDGIVSVSDVKAKVLNPLQLGRSWPWPKVTAATFGRRLGEVYGFGAGTGIGKTDLFSQMIAHDIQLGVPVGVIYLEQPVAETVRRVAGKIANKRFHVPDGNWTPTELIAAIDSLEASGKLHLLDHWGAMDWTTIKSRIRYMVTALGVEHVYLDHLTALAAAEDDERTALERIMAEMASLAQELRFTLHFVSHLATPEGKSHEEGGRVTVRHFKGSRAIGFWSHGLWGLERDQQEEDVERRCLTTLRCLKDRYTGLATGQTFTLKYDATNGLLSEADDVVFEEEKDGQSDF